MKTDVNEEIRRLVEVWCDRRELGALATFLPGWLANNGLPDGWEIVRRALKRTYAACQNLPAEERKALKRLYALIETALRNQK